MAKIGDTVRFLNSVGGGRIVRIDGSIAYVDEDGFETPVLLRECVVVAQAAPTAPKTMPETQPDTSATAPLKTPQIIEDNDIIEVEETPAGEKLNIVLAYEPADIKHLSKSDFNTFIVNDSNYFLFFTLLVKTSDSDKWTLRQSDTIDPGIVMYVDTITPEDLPEIDRIALQMVAYKKDRPFVPKNPVWIERRFDASKFCRLHCFTPNPYFDGPVISYDLINDDVPVKQVSVDQASLQASMAEKVRADKRPAHKRQRPATPPDQPLVVDLHIHELVDNTNGMSNADMLNLQIDTFRRVMDANMRIHGKKIVFIHGKGEGVLCHAILKELTHRYKGHDVQDASFLEYGYGATQVTIR